MATLDEVIAQLQKNNRSEAGRDSRHTMALNAIAKALDSQTTKTSKSDKEAKDSKKKTDRDDKKSRFRQILDFGKNFKLQTNIAKGITGLGGELKGLGKSLGGGLASLGGLAKKGAGGLLSFISKAALFIFLPAIIGFLQSPLFGQMIDYITGTLVPAVFNLYNNIILPLGKALFELGPGPLGLLALGTFLTVKLLPTVFGLLPTVLKLGTAIAQIGFGIAKVGLQIGLTLAKYGLKAGGKLLLGLGKGIVALGGAFVSIGKGVFKASGAILKSIPMLFDFKKLKAAFMAVNTRIGKTATGLKDSAKGGAAKSVGALGKFFGKAGPIMKLASKFGPIGLAVGAVIAALTGVYLFLTETEIGEKILGGIKNMFNSVIEFIGGIYTNHIKPMIDEALDFGASVLSGIFSPIIDYVSGIYTNIIKPKIDEALDFGASIISGIFDPVLNFISGIYDRFIKPKLETAIDFFKPVLDFFKPFIDAIKEKLAPIGNFISALFSATVAAAKKIMPGGESPIEAFKRVFSEKMGGGNVSPTPTTAQTNSAQRTEMIDASPQVKENASGQTVVMDNSARTVNNATTVQQASHLIVNPDPLLRQLTTSSI